MKKIIRGFGETIQLEGEYNPTSWAVRVFEVNGHREISVCNTIDWEEVPYKPVLDLFPDQPSLEQIQDAEDRRLAALKRNAKRAQTMCRRAIKAAPEESQRYTRSRGTEVPKSKPMYFTNMSFADIIGLCFQCDDGDVIVSHNANSFSRSYWLCTEPRGVT